MPPYLFSSEPPADLEDRWRPYTYLQYLRGVPEDAYQWSLSFVQTCRFAWRVPSEFEFFAGRVASLGIDRLDLAPAQVTELLRAVAGEGARVPGTPMKLRVARPWLAVFEEAVGDEPGLPPNWPAGLELHGEPRSVWIGRRVPLVPICPNLLDPLSDPVHRAKKQYADLDWSPYESTPFGWKLRDSPPLPPFFSP